MNRTILLALILVALLGLWPADRAWSYTLLFGTKDGAPGSGVSGNYKDFTILNRSSATDAYNSTYFGYTSSDFAGYYIGTIAGNTETEKDSFNTIIGHYIEDGQTLNQLKVQYEDFVGEDKGSFTSYGITLTVTFDSFKDEDEPTSGTWSLSNAYGFGFYAVKGANEFALYFVDPAESSGKWTTRHLLAGNGNGNGMNAFNSGPNYPALSHFSGNPTPLPAPEPTTLVLLGAGLLGLGFVGRRGAGR